jgi:uncharacterized membrane protein YdbT with pleckstrin-like domain
MATSYVESSLSEGEQLIYNAHFHPIIFAPPIVFAAVGFLAIGVALGIHDSEAIGALFLGGLLVLLLAAVTAIPPYIAYNTSEFAVTNRRVLIKIGWLRRKTLELLLQKVESVGVDQSLVGRMFNFGTITVRGTGGSREHFKNIAAPLDFRRQVQASTDEEHMTARPINQTAILPQLRETNSEAETKKCPHCISDIPMGATVCRFCARDVVIS